MNELEKCARILVLCEYAHAVETDEDILDGVISISKFSKPKTPDGGYHGFVVEVQPFADNNEGKQQLDAIVEWIAENRPDLPKKARELDKFDCFLNRELLKEYVKWCIQELIK